MGNSRIRTSIQTEFRAGALEGRGMIRNLGTGGLFVGTASIPDQGEAVRVSFRMPSGEPMQVDGLVWWTTRDAAGYPHPTPGFGICLLDTDDAYETAVTRLIG